MWNQAPAHRTPANGADGSEAARRGAVDSGAEQPYREGITAGERPSSGRPYGAYRPRLRVVPALSQTSEKQRRAPSHAAVAMDRRALIQGGMGHDV